MPTNIVGFTIFGAIEQKWIATGGQHGPLNLPTSNETPTFDGVGRYQTFKWGTISWHPETGANAVWGLIGAKWWEVGREQYGYPITDELPTPDGKGRFNHFRSLHESGKPEKSIYWTPQTGAQEIYGGIREHWKNLGWERSSLGYPIGAERNRPGGGRMQEFENGIIDWTPEKGPFLRK